MKIKEQKFSVAEIAAGFAEDLEGKSVVGYGGKLNIRPPYQREFVYKQRQQEAVVATVHNDYPLNAMYWAECDDGTYEVLDGQQRTISICRFVADVFSCTGLFGRAEAFNFTSLEKHEQEQILAYKITVYICSGSDREKLNWFETVNIAGEKLFPQELRNAVYHGPWVSSARKYFSKPGGRASAVGGKYMKGKPIRQDYLQHAIKWIGYAKDQSIVKHMSTMRQQPNAEELRKHFEAVIAWVRATFPEYRKVMKLPDWGLLYHKHGKCANLDKVKLETRISKLMRDEEVTNQPGIYDFVLSGDESALNIREFEPEQKEKAYKRQKGLCNGKNCPDGKKKFALEAMQADHIKPWSKGGKTNDDNLQMLCRKCNARKGNK